MMAPVYAALLTFFGTARHVGLPVPTVFADPDEAHEEIKELMKKRARSEPSAAQTTQAMGDRAAPVPFMSIFMTPDKFDPKYYNPGRVVVSRNKGTLAASVMQYPRSVVADVQVDLWCGVGGHTVAQLIEHQIDLRFNGEVAYLPVDWTDSRWYRPPFDVLEHAKVMGQTKVRLLSDGWVDNTELERGTGRKDVRRTWSGRMETYIPYHPTEARITRQLQMALYDNTSDPPTLLESWVVGAED